MSPPIFNPDGSEVSEIVLPDGSTASEVIGPDGNVVFEAGPDIPDSGVFRWDCTNSNNDTSVLLDVWGTSGTGTQYDGTNNGASFSSGTGPTSDGEYVTDNSNNEYVESSYSPSIDGELTYAVRAKITSTGTDEALISPDDGGADWAIAKSSGDFGIYNGSGFSGNSSYPDSNYHWYIARFDAPNSNADLFVDKTEIVSTVCSTGSTGNNLRIASNPGFGKYMSARFADVRVYNKYLTNTEVDSLVDSGSI